MIKPIKIAIVGLDKTEAMFANLQARFRKLGTAIDKVKNRFPLLSSAFAKVGSFLKSAISAVVKSALAMGAAFTVAFTAITVKTMSSIDALGKMSSKIGTTAGSLSKLQFAAEQTGVSAETMGMAMQRFTRRAAEAARGTGEAKGALKELNLNAAELIKMPLEDQVLALSKSFENVETSADKVRLAMKLFDSEGVALVNTLGAGSDGLQAMFSDAEALGLVLSEDAVNGVEAANDSMNRLRKLFVGFSRQATAAFAPAIDEIAKSLTELGLKAADGDVQNIGQVIAKSIVGALVSVIQVIEKMMNAFGQMAHKIQGIYKSFFPDEEMKKDQEKLDKLTNSLFNLRKSETPFNLIDTTEVTNQIADLQAKMAGGEFVPFDFSFLINKLLEVKEVIGTVEEDVKDVIEEIVVLGERNWFDRLISSVLDFKDKFGEAFGRVKDQIFDFDSDMNSLVTGSVDAMVKVFTDMMTGAKSFGNAMKDMAKTVIDALMKMYVKYLIVQPLFDMMFPNARKQSDLPVGKALGGPVQANTPYLVGERGPELFMPNSGGNIIPNNEMGGGGSSVVVQQTINVTTGVQQTVRAEIVQLMPQIAQAAKGAVADARLRGGNFSKAMAGA